MIRKMIFPSLAVIALALEALPASAIDLTGTWMDQRSTCRRILPTGEVERLKDDQVLFSNMRITQFGDGSMNVEQGVFEYRGRAYAKGSNPAIRAEGLIEKCDDPFPEDQVGWKIKDAKTFLANSKGVTGVMNAEVLHNVESPFGDYIEICQVKFERTSTTDPNIPACP